MSQEQQLSDFAEILKLLGHPLRLEIVWVLHHQGELNVSSLQNRLKADRSLISHYLIKMKDRGILDTRRQEKEVVYFVADPFIVQLVTLLLNRRKESSKK